MATVAAVPALSGSKPLYRPRGPDPLRRLFCLRLPAFQSAYEQRYAPSFGRFRLPLITCAASAFRLCGDWSQGITRLRCPECGFDRAVFADIGGMLFDTLSRFFSQAAGRAIRSAMVSSRHFKCPTRFYALLRPCCTAVAFFDVLIAIRQRTEESFKRISDGFLVGDSPDD